MSERPTRRGRTTSTLTPAGITPVELAQRSNLCPVAPLSPRLLALAPDPDVVATTSASRLLARWLVDGRLADDRDGVLYPTALVVELGGAIDWTGRDQAGDRRDRHNA